MKTKIIIILFILSIFVCGCSTQSKIEYRDREVFVHDTIEKQIVDTIIDVQKEYDSINIYVRDNQWIDSLGVVHQERYEREVRNTDKYKNLYEESKSEINRVRDSAAANIQIVEKEIIKEKKVYVLWPAVLISIASFCLSILLYFRLKKKQ